MKRVTRETVKQRLYRCINMYRKTLELKGLYSEHEIYMITAHDLEITEEDYNNAVKAERGN